MCSQMPFKVTEKICLKKQDQAKDNEVGQNGHWQFPSSQQQADGCIYSPQMPTSLSQAQCDIILILWLKQDLDSKTSQIQSKAQPVHPVTETAGRLQYELEY